MGQMQKSRTTNAEAGDNLQNLAVAIGHVGNYVDGMRERLRLLEAVVDNFPGGISVFDQDLNMVLCNEQLCRMLEYPEALFVGGYPSMEALFRCNAERGEYGPGDPDEQVARRIKRARKGKPHVFERTRPNGAVIEVRGVPVDGGGFVTTYFDITEQRRTQSMIAHMAHHDTLTNLPNRTLFADRLQNAIALAKRNGMVAVHCLDIHGFKAVNDSLGHKMGDELLIAAAQRLSDAVRENDTVARLGSDEFAIVQTGIKEVADAAVLARRALECFAKPFNIQGNEVRVGISIGIACAPKDATTVDDLLGRADAALERSRSSGGGVFSLYGATGDF